MGAPCSMAQAAREVAPIFMAMGERVLAEEAAARAAARRPASSPSTGELDRAS